MKRLFILILVLKIVVCKREIKELFFHYERPNYTIFSTEQTELMCENLASLIAPFFAQNVFSWPFGKSLI